MARARRAGPIGVAAAGDGRTDGAVAADGAARRAGETHWMTPQEKLLQLASPFINYLLPLDIISAALVFGAVALGVATVSDHVAPHAIRPSRCLRSCTWRSRLI